MASVELEPIIGIWGRRIETISRV